MTTERSRWLPIALLLGWFASATACDGSGFQCGPSDAGITCQAKQICVISQADFVSYRCEANPCGAEPLSCSCAEPACAGFVCSGADASTLACVCLAC